MKSLIPQLISSDIEYLSGRDNWKDLKSIGKVESIREVDEKRSIEMRYYILDQNISAEEMSHIVRGHWEIENNLHWVLVQKFLNKWTIFLFCSILFSSNQKEH